MLVVVMEKYIIVSGGETADGRKLGESYILNTGEEKQEWKRLDIILNTPRSWHTAVVLNNNKIYIYGGRDSDDNFLNTIGQIEGDEKSGNILLWKRKAEKVFTDY